ncbi:VCBS repeat-containing protein [Streptomyces sp. NPDC059875]|uniref:VCBS repeat-containing protein n=1 Tax=unclassified Streptomyces TaxID=2593676 RepID=UPI0036574083
MTGRTGAGRWNRWAIALVLTMTATTAVLPESAGAAVAQRARSTDLNGDGAADVVVASSARLTRWTDPAMGAADLGGSVYLLPGGPTGARPAQALLNQDNSPTVPGSSELGDTFGQSVATGDFDNDGKADVAFGNPHEEVGGILDAGAVTVQYGQSAAPYLGAGAGGLTWVDQNAQGIPGDNEPHDRFGTSLITGYFNDDAYADLAIGAPGEAVGTAFEAGRVTVLYGGPTGLAATGAQHFDGTVAGAAEPFDHFGASLAAADLKGDGRDDLAVLASGEFIGGVNGAWGAAIVLTGSTSGLDATAPAVINVGNTGTSGHVRTLVAGRFHGSAYADLALFADQRRGAAPRSGAVVVAPGGSTGIGGTPVVPLANSSAYADAYWGGALAAGDVNGDGLDELAVGALRGSGGTGSVTVFIGDPAGLTARPSATFTEDSAPLTAVAKPGEGFGYAVSLQDHTGDGLAELLVSAPWEDATAEVARTSTTGSTLFELGLTIPASGPASLTSALATQASGTSAFGPGGVGLAGGVTALTENGVEPFPWLDRLPPLFPTAS